MDFLSSQKGMIPYEELPITNNFIFCKVFSDKDICKEFLETMLHIKISHIEKCSSEVHSQTDGTAKSVRFDVYLEDGENMFDLEMQMANKTELRLRSRFYQAICDIESLGPGDVYAKLKQSYIIFICPFDLFKKKLPVYSFEYTCDEDSSIKLGDKTKKMFINFSEYAKIKDEKAKAILKYFKTGKSSDSFTKKIQASLDRIHRNPEDRRQFMTFGYMLMEERLDAMEKGRREGRKEGRAERAEIQKIVDSQAIEIATLQAKVAELEKQLAH